MFYCIDTYLYYGSLLSSGPFCWPKLEALAVKMFLCSVLLGGKFKLCNDVELCEPWPTSCNLYTLMDCRPS